MRKGHERQSAIRAAESTRTVPSCSGRRSCGETRGPLPTTQRAVRLREKILPAQASCSRCTRPSRGRDQTVQLERGPQMAEIQLEGGKLGETHRGRSFGFGNEKISKIC